MRTPNSNLEDTTVHACARLQLACARLQLACARLQLACARLQLACARLQLACACFQLATSRLQLACACFQLACNLLVLACNLFLARATNASHRYTRPRIRCTTRPVHTVMTTNHPGASGEPRQPHTPVTGSIIATNEERPQQGTRDRRCNSRCGGPFQHRTNLPQWGRRATRRHVCSV